MPFDWTINPYRGCEYGCKYCYARFTHEFLERHDPEAFETEIYAKDWDPRAFSRELRKLKPGDVLAIGTATDPYQPAERRFRRTAEVLEALLPVTGISIYLTTKSDLVSRDAELLAAVARQNRVRISVTVTTVDEGLARLLEPYAPRPELRLQAVQSLITAGAPTGVLASPVLPMITDSEESLDAVAVAAKAAGAQQFSAGVLFLRPQTQRVFFPFLAERFPQHLRRYEASFRAGAYLTGAYPEMIGRRVDSIRERHGFPAREYAFARPNRPEDGQLRLF